MPTPPEALPRQELERKLRGSRRLNLVLAAVAAVALIFGAAQWVGANSALELAAQQNTGEATVNANADEGEGGGAAAAVNIERRIDGDPMAIGALDAPIVLSEWLDFRCPFCAVYARDTFPVLLQEYVDAGLVRIEVHDVAFFGDESARAAAAARAAGEQGKYFEFMSALYAAAPESGHPELPVEQLIQLAAQAKVPDLARFEVDMQRADLLAAVEKSTTQAHQLGINSVPFFVVGSQGFAGAQPIENFRGFLDQQLSEV